MIPGYNHNIKYHNQVFHVQTEDSGVENPHIITHIFLGGNIVVTRKSSYLDISKNENVGPIVTELMREQHKAVCKELIHGKFDSDIQAMHAATNPSPAAVAAAAVKPPPTNADRSLDDIILEYLSKETK